MRNKLTSFAVVYVLVMAAFVGFVTFGPGTVEAAGLTFYVDDDNAAGPWDGSMANPYQTINDAIAASTDGDTIYVFNGTYKENVVVDRSLSIIGNGTGNTTIDGQWSGDVVTINANLVNITGFTITNGSSGIFIDSYSNNNIINNNISPSFQRGIYLISSSNNNITQNNISGAGYGIWVESSDNNNISANNMSDNEYGVYLSFSLNCDILSNDFLRGGVVIYGGTQLPYYNSHTIPTDNLVNGNPLYYYKDVGSFDIDSIPVGQVILVNCSYVNVQNLDINYTTAGIQLAFTNYANVFGNNVSNGYYGIYAHESSYINIEANNISNTQYSIYASDCSYINVSSCMVLDARYGIYLTDTAYGNIIGNDVSLSLNHGIYLLRASSINVIGNDVYLNTQRGIYLSSSDDNNITANNISSNDGMGIEVYSSEDNTITGNTFTNDGLFFWGGTMPHFNSHTVPTSNTVNGKPLYYYKDTNNLVIDGTTMGQLILANCNDADVKNLDINDTDVGIQVAYCLNATVSDNNLFDNDFGLYYSYSDNGVVINNKVVDHTSNGINSFYSDHNLFTDNNASSNSGFGIYLSGSHYNNVTENNASGNIEGVDIFQSDYNTIANNTAGNNNQYGIYMHNDCNGNTIINNNAYGNDHGINLAATTQNRVENNTLTSNSNLGILLNTCGFETIVNNDFSTNGIGIQFANSNWVEVMYNTFTDQGSSGIYTAGGSIFNTFSYNTFASNGVGISFMDRGHDNTISHNDFNNNTNYAVYLTASDRNEISYNNIKDNMGSGIYLSDAENNTMIYNDIINNSDYAIYLLASSNNVIHHNNIAYNQGSNDTFNASNIQAYDDGSNFWNTSDKGNWWADWTIPDILAPFGIVDNPYVLDGSGQDNFPLVNPVDAIPPMIFNLQPADGIAILVDTTTISANYSDVAGINVSNVMMDVDGMDVTLLSVVGPDGIYYDPGAPFTEGTHTINLTVMDIHDNVAVASWSFIIDTIPPVIVNRQPPYDSIISDNMTTISADYSDAEGIDTGSVQLWVDGIEQTSNATITANNISFIPMTPLSEGPHTAEISVYDISGWNSVVWWPFTVDAIPPVIFNMLPLNGTTLDVNITTISANYTDAEGINVSTVVLKINGGDVTSSATVTSDGISYTPAAGLTDGIYIVELEVKNIHDNPANVTWMFIVDTKAPDITNLQPADASSTSDDTVTIGANFTDLSGIDMGSIVLLVDGSDETLSAAITADGISFDPAAPWSEGSHTIELRINDTLGNAAVHIWSFEVDTTPPEDITDLAASDPTTESINLTWTAPGDDGGSGTATEYEVKYSTSGEITDANWNSASTYSQSWTPLAAGETESYMITGLDPETQYWFAIRALDEVSNTGGASNSPDATTLVVTTAPEVPQNLELEWGDSYVHLTWDAPVSDGNSPITNYVIYRGTSSSSIPFLIELGNVLTYNDTTPTNGIRYYYKVSAKNAVGEGLQTNRESATPAALSSAPQNVQVSAGVGYVEITWNEPADDGGLSISNYVVYRGNASGQTVYLTQLSRTVLIYNDTDVEAGVTYYYIIRAKTSLGEGAETTEVSGTPAAPPNLLPISGISSLTAGQVLEGTVTIEGTASDPEGGLVRVEMKIDDGSWFTVTGTDTWSHDLDTTTLSNGDHTIYIRSYDGTDYSAEDSVTVEVSNPEPKEDKTLFEEAWFFPLIIIVIIIIVLLLLMMMRKKPPEEGMPEEEDIPPEGAPEEGEEEPSSEEEQEEETVEEAAERPLEEETLEEEVSEEAPEEAPGEEPVEEQVEDDTPSEETSDEEIKDELVDEKTSEEEPTTESPESEEEIQ